ncbi:MAG: D-alanyl-D-alanine carboxypeptidase [Oscillospiraceae bacterium]|nr:D-alanyl-D-alanine carboxypeptidase [Oscillospiraceae bacterium]
MESSTAVKEKDKDIRDQQKALRRKMHNLRAGILAFGILAVSGLLYAEISFMKTGEITVEAPEYTVITTEKDRRAEITAALNSVNTDSSKTQIDLTIPDYCPVNYTAYSPIAMVYDKTDGKVLYAKNENERCSPASTMKLMTAAVALDLSDKDFIFTAGEELDLVQEGASLAKIKKCYSMDRAELIDGIILKGGSDVSYTAAANIGRLLCDTDDVSSFEAVSRFVQVMNTTAENIGAKDTNFTNPDGFYDEDNYTTAADMIRIAVYASKHEEIMSSASKDYAGGKLYSGQSYEWANTNKMVIESSNDYYEYATGLKTGMTENSGYCMVATAERYGHEIVCVVMNCDTAEHRLFDVESLLDISFKYLGDLSNAPSEAS